MRNKRILFVLFGAAAFGLVAAVAVSRYLSNAQALTRDMRRVVVAKVDVPLGTKLVGEQLSTVQMPWDATPAGAFEVRDKRVGRCSPVQIAARQPVTDYKLAPEGSAAGLSAVIPEGYRAMTVKVDAVVVVIQPNDNTTSGTGPVSKIVLQNIKVLASGQNIDQPKNGDREAQSVKAVTLQVTPEEAEKLALASTEGKLQLVMRNSIDQDDEQTRGVDKRPLLGGEPAAPQPAPGSLKSEQPKQRPVPAAPAPVFEHRPSAGPAPEAPKAEKPPKPPPTPPAPVEMFEGAKKRNVDFP